MEATDLVAAIYECLQKHRDEFPELRGMSIDGDHKSCEIMLDCINSEGAKVTFVISSTNIIENPGDKEDWKEDGHAPKTHNGKAP